MTNTNEWLPVFDSAGTVDLGYYRAANYGTFEAIRFASSRHPEQVIFAGLESASEAISLIKR